MKSKNLLLTACLLLLTACSVMAVKPSATPGPTPTSTPTLIPSTTPSPIPTSTPTFVPSKLGTADLDVTYCTMNGLPQKMDIYYPESGGPWPVLVYVHGGSWRELDKAEGVGWSYLNDYGYLVVSVNYRLATSDIKFPVMIEDVKCAVRYLRANSSQYNIDTSHIGALGASAGGHLVALLGTSDKSAGWDVGEYLDQSSRVQAVVTLSGLSDFTQPVVGGVSMAIYFAFGALAGTNLPVMAAASPVTYITPDDPPFLIIHGDQDGVVPVVQAETLNGRLTEAGVPSTLVIVKNGDHSLKALPGKTSAPSQEEISQIILEFLEKNLKQHG